MSACAQHVLNLNCEISLISIKCIHLFDFSFNFWYQCKLVLLLQNFISKALCKILSARFQSVISHLTFFFFFLCFTLREIVEGPLMKQFLPVADLTLIRLRAVFNDWLKNKLDNCTAVTGGRPSCEGWRPEVQLIDCVSQREVHRFDWV